MSNLQNDILLENLTERMNQMSLDVTDTEFRIFEVYVEDNDLEGAQAYVAALEARYLPRQSDDGLIDISLFDEPDYEY